MKIAQPVCAVLCWASAAPAGESFAPANPSDRNVNVPLDAEPPPDLAEPLGGILAMLAGLVAPDREVVLRLGGAGTIRGTVTGHCRREDIASGVMMPSISEPVAEAGRYKARGVPSGTVLVVLHTSRYSPPHACLSGRPRTLAVCARWDALDLMARSV